MELTTVISTRLSIVTWKPENILLDSKKNIRIIDFGLSNTMRQDKLLKTACGSPCYASPEMIAGHRYEGPATDIWSMGVILFALICGYLPFEDPSTPQLYSKILSGKFTIPSFLSKEAASLLRGILTVDPNRRFSIEDIRQHPWYSFYKSRNSRVETNTAAGVSINYTVVDQLVLLGFDREYAIQSLKKNKHNSVTATYHLLHDKLTNSPNGTISPAVLQSLSPPVSEALVEEVPQGEKHPKSPLQKLDVIPEEEAAVETLNLSNISSTSNGSTDSPLPDPGRRFSSFSDGADYLMAYRRPSGGSVSRDYSALSTSTDYYTASVSPDNNSHRRRHSLAPSVMNQHKKSKSVTTPLADTSPDSFSRYSDLLENKPSPDSVKAVRESHTRRASIAIDSNFVTKSGFTNKLYSGQQRTEMRVHKGPFNNQTTSSKSPYEIMNDIKTCLSDIGISFKESNEFLLEASTRGIKFGIEIRKLYGFDSLYVVTYGRLSGDTWRYKTLCQEISGKLTL
ncbi:hypothetical protein GEMRC1_006061 [Eukaryota sp. GEM-RC1]